MRRGVPLAGQTGPSTVAVDPEGPAPGRRRPAAPGGGGLYGESTWGVPGRPADRTQRRWNAAPLMLRRGGGQGWARARAGGMARAGPVGQGQGQGHTEDPACRGRPFGHCSRTHHPRGPRAGARARRPGSWRRVAYRVTVLLECAGLRARGRGRGVWRVQTGRHRQRAARGTPLSRWSCRAMLSIAGERPVKARLSVTGRACVRGSCVRAW